jgi:mono/diheme cytochrome c family protein
MLSRAAAALLIGMFVLLAGAAIGALYLVNRGFSARAEPSRFEEFVALRLRALATPRAAQLLENPLPHTAEVLASALRHFADHCAICHGNDGSGDTDFGRGMYPKPPDMRLARTQALSDGELFYIIEHGVRFTGMPGFGVNEHIDPTGAAAEPTWELVHFIRHLPDLTDEELAVMETLNPRGFEEWRREEEIRRFLEGEFDEEWPPAHENDHRLHQAPPAPLNRGESEEPRQ